MRTHKDPRHIARILVVMDLYNHFYPESQKYDVDGLELGEYSRKLREKLFEGVREKTTEIDELVDANSSPVKVSDLDLLLLQVIRIAVYEGFIGQITPPKVAVDEAIELTRDFGNELSVKKISGILGKIYDKYKSPQKA